MAKKGIPGNNLERKEEIAKDPLNDVSDLEKIKSSSTELRRSIRLHRYERHPPPDNLSNYESSYMRWHPPNKPSKLKEIEEEKTILLPCPLSAKQARTCTEINQEVKDNTPKQQFPFV